MRSNMKKTVEYVGALLMVSTLVVLNSCGGAEPTESGVNESVDQTSQSPVKKPVKKTDCTEWTAVYNGPIPTGDAVDEGLDVALDEDGNVYIVGSTQELGADGISSRVTKFITRKYDSEGNLVWSQSHPDGQELGAIGRGIAVHKDNIYLTGDVSTGSKWKMSLRKNTVDGGDDLWETVGGGLPEENGSSAKAVAVDLQGNIYVTGSTNYSIGQDAFVSKFDPEGNELWTVTSSQYDLGVGIGVDPASNVYVVGSILGNNNNGVLMKYDKDGNLLASFLSDYPKDDRLRDVVWDRGSVYVAGLLKQPDQGGTVDIWVEKRRASDLKLIWSQTYDGVGNGRDQAIGVAVDAQGDVYVTGTSEDGVNIHDEDPITLKYSKDGTLLGGRTTPSDPTDGDGEFNRGFRVAAGPGDAFYVVGTGFHPQPAIGYTGDGGFYKCPECGMGSNPDIWITKYCSVDPSFGSGF